MGKTGWSWTLDSTLVGLPVAVLEVWDGLGASNQPCPKALCTALIMETVYHRGMLI